MKMKRIFLGMNAATAIGLNRSASLQVVVTQNQETISNQTTTAPHLSEEEEVAIAMKAAAA